ncbi:MAG: DMT family transporter [Gammaproteobacteria bacterium]|nr:DMT family transporter [Gammaproteobacteria bacterium]
MTTHAKIQLKLIIATAFWALTPIIARLLADYTAPYALAFGRFLIAACALHIFIRVQGKSPRLTTRHLIAFAILGFSGICLHSILVFMGVETTQANRANVIFATIPIMVALIDAVFLGRRYRAGAVVGILLGIIGTAVVVSDGVLSSLLGAIGMGEWLILASAASWAWYSVAGRTLLTMYSPLEVTYFATLFGTVMLAPFVALDWEVVPRLLHDPAALAMIIFLGIVNSAIGFLWYYEAVQKIGAVTTSAYINLVPIFGVLLSALILGEVPSPGLLIGGSLVILALVLINRFDRPLQA